MYKDPNHDFLNSLLKQIHDGGYSTYDTAAIIMASQLTYAIKETLEDNEKLAAAVRIDTNDLRKKLIKVLLLKLNKVLVTLVVKSLDYPAENKPTLEELN